MNNEAKNLVEEIKQIRAQYEAEVGVDKRRAWPKAIKVRVLRLCELTRTFKEAGELVGISPDSIDRIPIFAAFRSPLRVGYYECDSVLKWLMYLSYYYMYLLGYVALAATNEFGYSDSGAMNLH